MSFDQPALSQSTVSAAQADPINVSYERLIDVNQRIRTITKDLLQLSRRDSGRDLGNLIDNTQRATAYLFNAMDVLSLYQSMASAKDRENVRKSVGEILKRLIGLLEIELNRTKALADITKPGIATSGHDLINAIRESIDTLNAVRL